MRTIRSIKAHSSSHPYAAFDAEKEIVTLCANWKPQQTGRWRCELHIENSEQIIKETVISKPRQTISSFLEFMQESVNEIFDEMSSITKAQYQVFLMSRK